MYNQMNMNVRRNAFLLWSRRRVRENLKFFIIFWNVGKHVVTSHSRPRHGAFINGDVIDIASRRKLRNIVIVASLFYTDNYVEAARARLRVELAPRGKWEDTFSAYTCASLSRFSAERIIKHRARANRVPAVAASAYPDDE